MKSHLSISVGEIETKINYVVDDEVIVSHMHPVGFKHIEESGMNVIAGSKLIDGIIYTLEFISLHDRIPTNFVLRSIRHATWIGKVIENASYTQFYTNDVPISVTLESTQGKTFSYARHSQTIHSFKI